ncbi:MAG: hypothetical protein ACI38Q_04200 [Candidatus Bruticola sp.]
MSVMLSKKLFFSIILAITAVCLLVVPSQAGIIKGVSLESFTGTLTEVSNISVNVVDYQNQKVVNAFVTAEIGYQNKLQENFKIGDTVRIRFSRDKQSGRCILASIKKLNN